MQGRENMALRNPKKEIPNPNLKVGIWNFFRISLRFILKIVLLF